MMFWLAGIAGLGVGLCLGFGAAVLLLSGDRGRMFSVLTGAIEAASRSVVFPGVKEKVVQSVSEAENLYDPRVDENLPSWYLEEDESGVGS